MAKAATKGKAATNNKSARTKNAPRKGKAPTKKAATKGRAATKGKTATKNKAATQGKAAKKLVSLKKPAAASAMRRPAAASAMRRPAAASAMRRQAANATVATARELGESILDLKYKFSHGGFVMTGMFIVERGISDLDNYDFRDMQGGMLTLHDPTGITRRLRWGPGIKPCWPVLAMSTRLNMEDDPCAWVAGDILSARYTGWIPLRVYAKVNPDWREQLDSDDDPPLEEYIKQTAAMEKFARQQGSEDEE